MKFNVAALLALVSGLGEAKTHQSKLVNKKHSRNLENKNNGAHARFTERLASVAKHRRTADQGEDADYNWDTDWEAQYQDFWNDELVVKEFGFDIDSYAIKYTGCHVAKGYNQQIAETENFETVLGADHYVTFRLCPVESCDSTDGYKYGCSKNYGEYMILLDEYIEALQEFREAKKENFCQYCEYCAAVKGYTEWNTQMQATVYSVAVQAKAFFEDYVTAAKYTNQQNNYNNEYDVAQYDDEDEYWIQNYYTYNRDNAQYQQAQQNNGQYNYNQNNMGQNNMGGSINSMQSNWWDYGNTNKNTNQKQYINQEFMNTEKGSWVNMNSNIPTFCKQVIENGYFDEDGEFINEYGYWNSNNGQYVSFESGAAIPWDSNCWGTAPFGWEDVAGHDPNILAQCDENLSSQCGEGYDECIFMLHFEDLIAMEFGEGYAYTEQEILSSDTAGVFKDQLLQSRFVDYLSCQATDYVPDDLEVEQTTYSNQANYQNLYNEKKKYNQAITNCGDSEDCITAVNEAMETDQQYQTWIIQSAWELYEKYKAANMISYVGASCDADGQGINIQVFHDENCLFPNENLSPSVVLSDEDITEATLGAVNTQCVPCRNNEFDFDELMATQEANLAFAELCAAQDDGDGDDDDDGEAYAACLQTYQNQQYYENQQQQGNYQDYQQGNYQDGQEGDAVATTVLPFCSMLYQMSAKCNKNLEPNKVYNQEGYYVDGVYIAPDFEQMYLSEQQKDQSKKVCGMVESLNSGSYKEDGSIFLNGYGWVAGDRFKNEVSSASASMSPASKSFVFLFAIGAAAMGLWAMVLQGAIKRKMAPWQPKDPVDLARQESGIVMGRSRSGPATSPLI
eukprot:CAMPEP_0198142852 /NCGR_PEP_ID=MMETSP1443-20131203/5527_1 /TAXON_ID=186043 /ORGANISM="Entomoneis sp., Strain CCMP2396" /LENGTH=848 /DNA_ID=CAMNT_0043805957 /DNA_START=39 /DNA_END=2585 /DNA_ORIENTATION=+